ncbi:MAG: SRPBCC family protein [bacterium]
MKIALIVLGVLVAVVLLGVVVGWSLPVHHRASREVTYAASPERIYDVITNVEDFPAWRPKVKSVEQVAGPNGARSFRESGADGVILYVVDEAVPGRRLVTRIADDKLPFGGKWTYELIPVPAGTTLRITEDGEVHNPIFRLVSRFVFGHRATIDNYFGDLGRKLSG